MFYLKKRDSTAQMTASIIISLIQLFIILDLLMVVRIIYEYPIPSNFNKYWALPLIILFFIWNWFKYVRNIDRVEVKNRLRVTWKNEELNDRRKRGYLILISMIVIFSIPIIYGFVRHNLMDGKSFWIN